MGDRDLSNVSNVVTYSFGPYLLALSILLVPCPLHASGLAIDDFSADQAPLTLTVVGTSAASSVDGFVLGIERDLRLNFVSSSGSGTVDVAVFSGMLFENASTNAVANVVIQWDGADNSPNLNTTGLGSVNLVNVFGDPVPQDAFLIRVDPDLECTLRLTVCSTNGIVESHNITVSATGPPQNVEFPYSTWTMVDMTQVSALQLRLLGVPSLDLALDHIYTTASGTAVPAALESPTALWLAPAYPNPTGTQSHFRIELLNAASMTLRIYDASGAVVATLIDGERQAGAHIVTWSGRNETGVPVGAGIYFARLQAAGESHLQKIVWLR